MKVLVEMFGVTNFDLDQIPRDENGEIDFDQDFFGKKTNLTVSGQLEAETAAMGLGRVYTFWPTFRAENSNTTRHLAEFWMVEPEVAFNNLEDNIDLAEDFLKYVIGYVLENCKDDLKF
jgi:asparaginyl-tRNA synthetase